MGDIHRGYIHPALDLLDGIPHFDTEFRIQVGQRFIHQKYLRPDDDRPRKGDTLLLTSREFVGILIALCLKADILECFADEALAFATSADTEGTQHDIEVVMHGLVGQELEVLEDDAKGAT